MRRSLIILAAIGYSAWSQPAQQSTQPPTVVQVQMPLESIWTTLVKLAIPTILAAGLGAGLALYGVGKTNKHNEAENAANRKHQLQLEIAKAEIAAKYRSRDNQWAFRKDVYVNILTTCDALVNALDAVAEIQRTINAKGPGHEALLPLQLESMNNIVRHQEEFSRYALLAPLAMAEHVAPLVANATKEQQSAENLDDPNACDALRKRAKMLMDLISALQKAGRKDLWPEPDARGAGTSQNN